MKRAGLLALLFFIAFVVGATQSPRVIPAVVAHPDDETLLAPFLPVALTKELRST
jgi:hypothetical protein